MGKVFANLPRYMAIVCAFVIALVPFHAFLTVWLSSGLGHYTALRLWKEVLLALLFLAFVVLFVTRPKLRRASLKDSIIPLIAAYVIFVTAIGFTAYFAGGVTLKALGYGLIIDTRYLLFFGITWAVTQFDDLLIRTWKRLLLIPAGIVAAFGTLEFTLLPVDFLRHFGYGPSTITPTATIDHQDAYRRIQSTLRGPNPLGAYMIIIVSSVGGLLTRRRTIDWRLIVQFLLAMFALIFSFSRSSWLGALASIIFVIWVAITSMNARKYLAIAAGVGVVVCLIVGFSLRNDVAFQNVFLHTSGQSHSSVSSNHGHVAALQNGLRDIARKPWGTGTGTAGPASVYNRGQVRIAENYYVQIGQETGLLGLCAFGAINVLVAVRLWRRRAHPLALTLLASFIGIVVVNLLGHAWADDTLAYIWWGLAGAAAALPVKAAYDSAK